MDLSSLLWKILKTKPTDRNFKHLGGCSKETKFISHDSAVNLMKREKYPLRAFDIFNRVSSQKGFSHNNSTYAVILHKLGQFKKFEAIDAVLHQMTYETCKFHEGIFLNLMTHFSKSSLHERVLEMFNAIQPVVREKPSLKAISTCLNLLVESDQVDLARTFLLSTKKNHNLIPNTCISTSWSSITARMGILIPLLRAGGIDEAINLLKEMEDKKCKADVVTFNVILVGLCKEGRSDKALCVLDRLFHEGVYLNKSSYRIVLNSLLSEGELQKGTELLGMMLDQEFVPHFATSNELLVRLCEAGTPADAAMVLCGLVEMGFKPEPEAWSPLIELMCRGRKLLATFQLMDGLAMGVNHE